MGSPDGGTDDVVRGKAETSREKKRKMKFSHTQTQKGCVTSHFCIMQNHLYTYKEIITISENG